MQQEEKVSMRLWYKTPACSWNEALPIGNGRLGAMLFGKTDTERIQLNEDSIWYGDPVDRNNPDARTHLTKIRDLIFSGEIHEAERLAKMALSGVPESQRPYQTGGDLYLAFDKPCISPETYMRELNIEDATTTVRYTSGGVKHTRCAFSSAVDQVMVFRLKADKPGQIAFQAYFRRERYLDEVFTENNHSLTMLSGSGTGRGVHFCTRIRIQNEGGTLSAIGENLVVTGADAVTIVLATETSFYHDDFEAVCTKRVDAACLQSYDTLLKAHQNDYMQLFQRVSFSLDSHNHYLLESLDTAERLLRMKSGQEDLELISLYFQFGRYLLISSSRPGSLPANLQGIWNQDMLPAWDSKFTININTQMNYWPAESCNLAECHLPLFDHLRNMQVHGRWTAQFMYGCKGFVAHHNTDIWGDTAPQDIWIPSTYWPMGAAWLCLHLWTHYEYNRDMDFLRSAYPLMKDAAIFLLDFLVYDPNGFLVTCPSVSPENTYRLPNGQTGSLCAGPSMDTQIIRSLFEACKDAAQALATDTSFCDQLQAALDKLYKPQIGQYGQIQEWTSDYEETEVGHRHISHLFGLHPGNEFTRRKTPALAQAARKTLERRLAHGGGHTGWSRAWIINLWARLGDGTKAGENLMALLADSTQPNMFDAHPPFQIDGNFGGAAGIAEMLLQCHDGGVELLPALPPAWAKGQVKGLRVKGGFELDFDWADHILQTLTVRSQAGQPFVWYGASPVEIASDGFHMIMKSENELHRIETVAGKSYTIRAMLPVERF